jgi:hypothetical protein
MMGREAGTPGNVKATDFLAQEARRIGLEPAGDGGTYFQEVPLVNQTLAASARLDVGGDPLVLHTDFLPLVPIVEFQPFGLRLSSDSLETVYGGRLGEPAGVTPEQVEGKLLVMAPATGPDGGPGWAWRSHLATIPLERAAAVAIATLEITPSGVIAALAGLKTSLRETNPRPAPFGMLISSGAGERIFGSRLEDLRPGGSGRPIRADLAFLEDPMPEPARNVVAILPGADPALRGEYVALGAHNDHIGVTSPPVDHDSLRAFNRILRPQGLASDAREPSPDELVRARATLDSLRALRPARPDSINNGADDDGSGSVGLLEIAEALAGARERPKRSILFVWHTAEEKGLFGSRWFTDHPTIPRDSIVAQLNIDHMGRGGASELEGGGPGFLLLIGSRRLSSELGELIEAVNRDGGHGFTFDYRYDAPGDPVNAYCRSDHAMYGRYGIPVAFFSTGLHQDYHLVTDEPQYIDYEKMGRFAGLVADVATHIANLDHRPRLDGPKPDPTAPCKQ